MIGIPREGFVVHDDGEEYGHFPEVHEEHIPEVHEEHLPEVREEHIPRVREEHLPESHEEHFSEPDDIFTPDVQTDIETFVRPNPSGRSVIPTPVPHVLDRNTKLFPAFLTKGLILPHSYSGVGGNAYPTKQTRILGPDGFPSIDMTFFVDSAHDNAASTTPATRTSVYDDSFHGEDIDDSEALPALPDAPRLRNAPRIRKPQSNGWFGVDNVSFDPHGTNVEIPNADPDSDQYVVLSHAHSDHVFNQNATVITTDPTWYFASRGQAIYGRQEQAEQERRGAPIAGTKDLRQGYFGSSGFRAPMVAGSAQNQKVIIADHFDEKRPDETRVELKNKNGDITGWLEFYPNGHMMGSTMTVYRPAAWSSMQDGKRIPGPGILYTGDFDPDPQSDEITPEISWPKNISYVVMEGTHYKKTNEQLNPADIYDVNKQSLRTSMRDAFLAHQRKIDADVNLPIDDPDKRQEAVPVVFGAWALGKSAEEVLFWIKNNQRPVVGEDIAFWIKMYDDIFKQRGEMSPFYEQKGDQRIPKFDTILPKKAITDNGNWSDFSKIHFPSFGQFVSDPSNWKKIVQAIKNRYDSAVAQISDPSKDKDSMIDEETLDFVKLVRRSGMSPLIEPNIFNILGNLQDPQHIQDFYRTTAADNLMATSKISSKEKDEAINRVNQKEATRQLVRRIAIAEYCKLIKESFKKFTTAGPGEDADIFTKTRPVIISNSIFSADNENKSWNQPLTKWWWLTGLGGPEADEAVGYHASKHGSPMASLDWYRKSSTPPGAERGAASLNSDIQLEDLPQPAESRRTRFVVTLNRPPSYRPELAIGSTTQFPYSPAGRIPLTAHATPGGTERVVQDVLSKIGPDGQAPRGIFTVHANQQKLSLIELLRQITRANHIGTNGKLFSDEQLGSGMFYPKLLLNSNLMWDTMNPAIKNVLTEYISQNPDSPVLAGQAINPKSGISPDIIRQIALSGNNNPELQLIFRSMGSTFAQYNALLK